MIYQPRRISVFLNNTARQYFVFTIYLNQFILLSRRNISLPVFGGMSSRIVVKVVRNERNLLRVINELVVTSTSHVRFGI